MPQETKLLRASNITTRKHYNTDWREKKMAETKMITIEKYMYDSFQRQKEQLQAIIRLAKAGTLTPDHVLIITGEKQEEE